MAIGSKPYVSRLGYPRHPPSLRMLFFFLVACGPGKVTLGGDTGTADTSVDTDTDTAVDTAVETGDSGPMATWARGKSS